MDVADSARMQVGCTMPAMTTVEGARTAVPGLPWGGRVADAWHEGRRSQRRESGSETAVLALLVGALVWVVGRAARLPVLALGAACCVAAAGWVAGPAWVGLLTTAIAALFVEWRTSR